jgi:hypothetical protein
MKQPVQGDGRKKLGRTLNYSTSSNNKSRNNQNPKKKELKNQKSSNLIQVEMW